jgi:hypothetical protein
MTVLLRGDFDATQLRGFAKKTKDGPQARRLLALDRKLPFANPVRMLQCDY